MSADLDPRDADLADRLRALGQRPVDPALQSEHLTALAGVRRGSAFRTSLAGRLKVATGVFAGFLLGASGLTAAGAMGPLQPTAAKVVEAVAPVDVPKGRADEAKAAAKAAKDARGQGGASRLEDGSIGTRRIWDDGCVAGEDGTFAGNRGQYLKQEKAKGRAAFETAKGTDCGKPVGGDDEAEEPADVEATEAPEVEDEPEVEGAENGRSTEEHGKATAPVQQDDATKGKSAEHKPADAGRSAEAPAGPPASAPAPQAEEHADEDADLPEVTPGTPAEPEAKPGRADV